MTRPAHRPPARTGISPECEREFALRIAEGHKPDDAARLAGFPSSARPNWAMRTSSFAEALRRAMSDRLNLLAPGAVAVLETLANDTSTPARVRVDAAKALLDRAGYPAGMPFRDKEGDTRPEDMTPAELAELIQRLEREKSERAEVVNASEQGSRPPGATTCPPAEEFLA